MAKSTVYNPDDESALEAGGEDMAATESYQPSRHKKDTTGTCSPCSPDPLPHEYGIETIVRGWSNHMGGERPQSHAFSLMSP